MPTKHYLQEDPFRQRRVALWQAQVACVADVYLEKNRREGNCERVQTTKKTGRGARLLAQPPRLENRLRAGSPLTSRTRIRRARLCSNVSLIIGYVIEGITSKITLSHLMFRLYTPHIANFYNEQARKPLRKREILPNSQYYHFYVIWLLRRSRNKGNTTAYWRTMDFFVELLK